MEQAREEVLKEVSRYLYKKNVLIAWIERSKHALAAALSGDGSRAVLDLGCGFGEHFSYGAQNGMRVGLDINLDLLRSTRQAHPGVSLIQADAGRIPFQDHSLDCIVTLSVLEHIPDIDVCLCEMKRVLKERGRLIVGLPSEGLLFKVGRALTVKKYITKKFNIDYEDLCKREHVNESSQVVEKLKKAFRLRRVRGAPFIIPSKHLNAFLLYEFKP